MRLLYSKWYFQEKLSPDLTIAIRRNRKHVKTCYLALMLGVVLLAVGIKPNSSQYNKLEKIHCQNTFSCVFGLNAQVLFLSGKYF